MQVLSPCVQGRVSWHFIQLIWRFHQLFLPALHLALFPESPASFKHRATSLWAPALCRSIPASDIRFCVQLLQKMFAQTLLQLMQPFQVTLEMWVQHRNCAGRGRREPGKQVCKVLRWVQHDGAHMHGPR